MWFSDEDGVPVLHLSGEIDAATVAHFEREHDGTGPVVRIVDAGQATFLNSTGVGFLIRRTAAARKEGTPPLLRRPSRAVLQVLRLVGADGLFDRG